MCLVGVIELRPIRTCNVGGHEVFHKLVVLMRFRRLSFVFAQLIQVSDELFEVSLQVFYYSLLIGRLAEMQL